jgi:putative transposase
LSDKNEEIADWLERLTENKRTWGFGLCFLYLRNVQGQANRAPMVRETLAALEPQTRASDATANWS